MKHAPADVLDGLKEFDTATVFNAVVESMGASQGGGELEGRGGTPRNYTGPGLTCYLPEFGTVVGYAITTEITTSDPDSPAIPWDDYYEVIEESPVPIIAVMKDVDSQAGRGATFGDGMAAQHKALGVTGVIVDGSIRDLMGIKNVGMPVWGTGLVAGHGVLNCVRVNASITVAGLRINPGELLVADLEGCVKIPEGHDPAAVLEKAREIREREAKLHTLFRDPEFTRAKLAEFLKDS